MSRTPGRGPRAPRAVTAVLTGTVLLTGGAGPLAACTPDDSPRGPAGDPTPLTQAEQRLTERCGQPWAEPEGDNSFRVRPYLRDDTAGLQLTLDLELLDGPDHGRHSARGLEVDLLDDNVVVAVTTSAGSGGGGIGDVDVWASGRVGLSACPDAEESETLPDGGYRLRASGPVSPLDHLHAQQEYWVAEPIEVTIAGGNLVGR